MVDVKLKMERWIRQTRTYLWGPGYDQRDWQVGGAFRSLCRVLWIS